MSSLKYIFVIQGNALVRIPAGNNEAETKEAPSEEIIKDTGAARATPEHLLETEKPKPRNKRNTTSRG